MRKDTFISRLKNHIVIADYNKEEGKNKILNSDLSNKEKSVLLEWNEKRKI